MFFTQEDYKKIQKWLLLNSVKDTEFRDATSPFKGDETIAFVQNGRNVKAPLKELVEQFLLLGVSDFLNVTTKFNEHYITLNQAINIIPFLSRKIGQVITFLDTEGNWQIYQFKGTRKNQWNNITLWENVISTLLDSKLEADEEDITTKKRGDKYQLKFKDKEYNKEEFSGLGKVILRKNVSKVMDPTEGEPTFKNLLTQPMFKSENTTYVIRYDYSLNGGAISLPKNSTLEFDGGSIIDGKIEGRNTRIINSTSKSFINIETTGTWNTELSEPIEGEIKTINVVRDIIANQDSITNIENNIDNIEEDIKDIDKDLSGLHEDFNNLPKVDGEDITVGEDGLIRFKNKEYSEKDYSGLGRVYLRKNVVANRNILTQEMINKPNTIYIIQYEYDLNQKEITIPENCVLQFEGGSISNGSIICNNTIINQGGNFSLISLKGSYLFKDNIEGFNKIGNISSGQISCNNKQCFKHTDGYWYTLNTNTETVINSNTIPDNINWSCIGLLNGQPINSSKNYHIIEGSYNAQNAWNNRNALCYLLRNIHYNYFIINGDGNSIYCIGSITPNRSNITIEITKNTKLVGRYNDSSIPASSATQGGHFFGIGITDNPDVWQGYDSRPAENVTIILDGDIATEYSSSHQSAHNNNVIGLVAHNSKVIGSGGISSSDHRGINFDFNAVNPYINISYIKNTYSNAVSVKGLDSNKATVIVDSIEDCVSETGDTNAIIICTSHSQCVIQIYNVLRGDSLPNNSTHLVFVDSVDTCLVKVGNIHRINHIVRIYNNVSYLELSGVNGNLTWDDASTLIRRASASVNLGHVKIKDMNIGGPASAVFFHESPLEDSQFNKLEVIDCNFIKCTYTGFKYFGATTITNNEPKYINIRNNISPTGYVANIKYPNLIDQISKDEADGTSRNITVYYKHPDYNWEYITIVIELEESSESIVRTYPIRTLIDRTIHETIGTLTLRIANNVGSTGIQFNVTGGTKPIKMLYKHN